MREERAAEPSLDEPVRKGGGQAEEDGDPEHVFQHRLERPGVSAGSKPSRLDNMGIVTETNIEMATKCQVLE
jgi:hypothetical protein